jgi:hypothetical protein
LNARLQEAEYRLDSLIDVVSRNLDWQRSRFRNFEAQLQALQRQLSLCCVPGSLQLKQMETDMDLISFKIVLPPEPAQPQDITGGILAVRVGEVAIVVDTQRGQTEVVRPDFVGPEGANVHTDFAYIDNAGNVGPAREMDFVLIDDQPPPQPGDVSLVTLGEQTSTEPAPSDVPMPSEEPPPSDVTAESESSASDSITPPL